MSQVIRWRHAALSLSCTFIVVAGACTPSTDTQEGDEVAATSEVVAEIPISETSPEVQALLDQGHYLADVGRAVEARAKFLAAAEADSDSVQANIYLAANAFSFEEFQRAVEAAAAAAESGVTDAERQLVEIFQTFVTNDTGQSVTLAEELVQSTPDSPRALVILAATQSGNNDNESARANYERALELDPQHPAALFGLANNYLFTEPKDFTKAEEWAQKAIAAYPEEAKGHEVMGDIKRAQNDLESALQSYNAASELDPTLEVAHHKRGHVNSFLGNIDDARAAYTQAIEQAPVESKSGYAVFRAFTNIHAGDMAAAIDELVALVDEIPTMGTPAHQVKGAQTFALNSAAQVALHAGMLDRAAELVARRNEVAMAIAEDVGTADAERLQIAGCEQWSGLLAAYSGDREAAAAAAAEIETLLADDDNPRKMEGAHFVLGLAALEAGDSAVAVEHLRQADYRNNIYVRYQLARAEEAAGNTAEAAELYRDVATFNFNSVGFALTGDAAAEKAAEMDGSA